jgi:hypothetical protein
MNLMRPRGVRRRGGLAGLLVVCLMLPVFSGCAAQFFGDRYYIAKDFDKTYRPRVRVLAVVPFGSVSDDPDAATLAASMRRAVYDELNDAIGNYSVTIQGLAETERRLSEVLMTDSAAAWQSAPELSDLLDVDAVMKGAVEKIKRKKGPRYSGGMNSAGAVMTVKFRAGVGIYDGTDGRLVWHLDIDERGDFIGSPVALRAKVGRVVARSFPYTAGR